MQTTGVTDVVSQICYQCSVKTTSFRVGSWEHWLPVKFVIMPRP